MSGEFARKVSIFLIVSPIGVMLVPNSPKPFRLMFVCLGNICRSPAAQAVMQALVQDRKVADRFEIDSAGTANYHLGKLPDTRMIAAGAKRGFQLTSLAKAITAEHIADRELVLAMDRENLNNIRRMSKQDSQNVRLLSDYLDETWPRDVPDPYYGSDAGFAYVLDMLEAACPKILDDCLGC